MKCPVCSSDTRVLAKEGGERRRQCTVCKQNFRTVELLKAEHDHLQGIVEDAKALAEKLAA
jgi:transcriptional regulator NrdR family protein